MDHNNLVPKLLNAIQKEFTGSTAEFKKLNIVLTTLCKAIEASQSNLNLSINGPELIKIKGRPGDKGKDGKTPKLGVDFLTPKEMVNIRNELRPVFGKDYFTDEQIHKMVLAATPKRGLHYYTDKDVKDIVTAVKKLIPKPKDGKPGKPGKDAVAPKLPSVAEIAKQVKIVLTEGDGKEIVKAINAITEADDKYKIDAKHIKGIKSVIQNFYGGGLGPRVTVSLTPPENPQLYDIWVVPKS